MTQSDSAPTSALRRKVAAAQDDKPPGSGRSALRALRLALARAASEDLDLPLAVIGARQDRCGQADIEHRVTGDRLLIVLDGAEGDIGAVVVDRALVAGLIQQQTMGRIGSAPPDTRPYTGTDAAMAAPLVDGLLSRVPELTDAAADRRCFLGYRFGARAEDDRTLLLTLEADKFRTFTLTVDLAGGRLQGEFLLLLPDRPPPPEPAEPVDEDGADTPSNAHHFSGLRVELNAVICRQKLSFSALSALNPGDLIPLTMPEGLAGTKLCTIAGKPVTFGRLGRINGLRAVRVNEIRERPELPLQDARDEFLTDSPVPEDNSDAEDDPWDGSAVAEGPQDFPTMGDLPDLPAPLPAVVAPPDVDGDDAAPLTPEQTMAEITELAGLDELLEGADQS